MHRSDNPTEADYKWCVQGKHYAPKTQFAKNKTKSDGLQGSCKTHDNERTREDYRERRRADRTGMSRSEYDIRYEEQKGCCAGCGEHFEVLCADHDHVTGQPRGLLCPNCNKALGLVNDNTSTLQRLVMYLRR